MALGDKSTKQLKKQSAVVLGNAVLQRCKTIVDLPGRTAALSHCSDPPLGMVS